MKYLLLILVPSSILQWLLLIAFAVAGWFIYGQRTGNQKDTANISGVIYGILIFYSLKNILGGVNDIFDRNVTKYFEYKFLIPSIRNTVFPSFINFLFSVLRIAILWKALSTARMSTGRFGKSTDRPNADGTRNRPDESSLRWARSSRWQKPRPASRTITDTSSWTVTTMVSPTHYGTP